MTLFVDDPDFQLHVGDAIDVLRTLPDESVHCVVTSPPYWGLRDYGTGSWEGGDPGCDHKQGRDGAGRADGIVDDRAQRNRDGAAALTRQECRCGARRVDQQLGLEPTPQDYVARMVEVFREVRRVLRRDGTCWLNLGDSYATMRNDHAGGGFGKAGGEHEQSTAVKRGWHGGDDLKPKDLCGIPWRVAFALQADGWYLRSEIIWAKPNPMPESVTDRPTKSHEQVFLLTRSPRYYFDQESIREPHTPDGRTKTIHAHAVDNSHENYANMGTDQERWPNGGRNARSVWNIATQPYAEAHFATFPEELPRRCIAAGTSERGCCPECGAPWERETTTDRVPRKSGGPSPAKSSQQKGGPGGAFVENLQAITRTIGWRPACNCDGEAMMGNEQAVAHPVPCVILDPFMGSGTVALVARRLGRRSIGIELNPDYAELAGRRLQQQSLFA